MKKIISLVLLLLVIGVACLGCGAPPEMESAFDLPAVSEGMEEDGDQQGEGESQMENPAHVDSPGGSTDGQKTGGGQNGSPGSSDQGGGDIKEVPPTSPPEQNPGKTTTALKCTFSINCSTVFDNLDKIDAAKVEILPADGWIYPVREIEFTEGESVFDILQRVVRQEKIHMESSSNPVLKSRYVEGINNLYEFDAGELSGWTYKVNGEGMGYGSSNSFPKNGDVIEWAYTCDLGKDVGVAPDRLQ